MTSTRDHDMLITYFSDVVQVNTLYRAFHAIKKYTFDVKFACSVIKKHMGKRGFIFV